MFEFVLDFVSIILYEGVVFEIFVYSTILHSILHTTKSTPVNYFAFFIGNILKSNAVPWTFLN